jgi:hypothetical protein
VSLMSSPSRSIPSSAYALVPCAGRDTEWAKVEIVGQATATVRRLGLFKVCSSKHCLVELLPLSHRGTGIPTAGICQSPTTVTRGPMQHRCT